MPSGLGPRFAVQMPIRMVLASWGRSPYEFTWSWGPTLRFHLNSRAFGALGPDARQIHMVWGPLYPYSHIKRDREGPYPYFGCFT